MKKKPVTFVDLAREPAIHVRSRTGWDLGKSADGTALAIRSAGGREYRLADYAPCYEAPGAKLASGAPLADLREMILHKGGASYASIWLIGLQQLCRAGGLEFPLVDKAGEHAIIVPQWRSFVPELASRAPPLECPLDRFACIRRHDNAWVVESPLCGARFLLTDLAALQAPLVRRALAATGFLRTGITENESRRRALAQWEFHDLLFHVHHRGGWHHDPMGAFFPYIGEIDPLPAKRQPWPGNPIELPRSPGNLRGESFSSVLERRRSQRKYNENHPITRRDIGYLLDRAARIRSSRVIPAGNTREQTVSHEITQRPYPSGGASYELEIYPVINHCAKLDPGLFHYDASRHALVQITGRTSDTQRLIADASLATLGLADPQVVLVIAARFARVMWKYQSISYGNILRNVGVLYQTLYLAATELNLSPCGIGAGDSALFAHLTGLDPVVEGSVGEFILGGRPEDLRDEQTPAP